MTITIVDLFKTFIPEYDNMKSMIEVGEKVRAVVRQKNKRWTVQILSEYSYGIYKHAANSHLIDEHEAYVWAQKQLSTWPNCEQRHKDKWRFKNKIDAEKFMMLFNLKWA